MAYRLVLQQKNDADSSSFPRVDIEKYIADPSHVLPPQAVEFSKNLIYEEYPVTIVDRQVRQLRTKDIPMVKILWSNHTTEDCMWETEVMMQVAYTYLFYL